MTETLLSPSNVLLFGRRVEDLQIINPRYTLAPRTVRVATTANIALNGIPDRRIDGVSVRAKDRILVKNQAANQHQHGIYIVGDGDWARAPEAGTNADFRPGMLIRVRRGGQANTFWRLRNPDPNLGVDPIYFDQVVDDPRHGPFAEPRRGIAGDVERQLTAVRAADQAPACFARIYGFSYIGYYYELPQPALFLVHGDGTPASEVRPGPGVMNRARALGNPSLTGLAAADFQFADDLMVWSYDKADYTIRMDVESGMFEDVLLDIVGGGGPGASGARVSGARVSGARVSGARVSGARLSGGRGDAGD